MNGKYIVLFILTIGAVLTALLLIYKPGPMSARKVAYVKQMELFGNEADFKISQAQIDTMSLERLDSAIVLFNHIQRAGDTLDLIHTYMISSVTPVSDDSDSSATTATEQSQQRAYSHADMYRMQNRKDAMLAYLDLLSGRLHNQKLVDSLAALALEPYPSKSQNDEFERLHSELYENVQ